jgi:hypothetical protein
MKTNSIALLINPIKKQYKDKHGFNPEWITEVKTTA